MARKKIQRNAALGHGSGKKIKRAYFDNLDPKIPPLFETKPRHHPRQKHPRHPKHQRYHQQQHMGSSTTLWYHIAHVRPPTLLVQSNGRLNIATPLFRLASQVEAKGAPKKEQEEDEGSNVV